MFPSLSKVQTFRFTHKSWVQLNYPILGGGSCRWPNLTDVPIIVDLKLNTVRGWTRDFARARIFGFLLRLDLERGSLFFQPRVSGIRFIELSLVSLRTFISFNCLYSSLSSSWLKVSNSRSSSGGGLGVLGMIRMDLRATFSLEFHLKHQDLEAGLTERTIAEREGCCWIWFVWHWICLTLPIRSLSWPRGWSCCACETESYQLDHGQCETEGLVLDAVGQRSTFQCLL